jgi:hypothetical protein
MNNTLTLEHVSSWMRDPDAYDPSARMRWFEVNGQRYTAHSVHGDNPEQWPLVIRDGITGKYVATVSNWPALPAQLNERLTTRMDG